MSERKGVHIGLFEVMQMAASEDRSIVPLAEKQRIVEVISLGLKEEVKKTLDYEFCSGVYIVYDVTTQYEPRKCKTRGCKKEAQLLDARIMLASTPDGESYWINELEPETREVLQKTRKMVRICTEHQMETMIKGLQKENYEDIDKKQQLRLIDQKEDPKKRLIRVDFTNNDNVRDIRGQGKNEKISQDGKIIIFPKKPRK